MSPKCGAYCLREAGHFEESISVVIDRDPTSIILGHPFADLAYWIDVGDL